MSSARKFSFIFNVTEQYKIILIRKRPLAKKKGLRMTFEQHLGRLNCHVVIQGLNKRRSANSYSESKCLLGCFHTVINDKQAVISV